jgi:integrase
MPDEGPGLRDPERARITSYANSARNYSHEPIRKDPMKGHVFKRKGARGTSWYYMHDLPPDPIMGRRQAKRGGFASQREAQTALTAELGKIQRGEHIEKSKITVGEFLEREWLPAIEASRRRKSGTLDQYRIYVEKRIVPAIGQVVLQDLDAATLDRFYATLGTRLAPKSVRNTAIMLSGALSFAATRRRIRSNPAKDAEMPKAERKEMCYWTPDETRRFLRHVADDRLYALWFLVGTTGLRRGEALGLRWQDVDLDGGHLSVVQSLVVNGGAVKVETPKTGRSRRSLSIPPSTLEALRRWRKLQIEERLAWGPDYDDSGLVFTRDDGSRLDPRTVSRTFDRLVGSSGQRRIRLHDVRHSYATAALRAGVSVKVVSERLGHKSVVITLDVYAHVMPLADEEAAAKVERLIVG